MGKRRRLRVFQMCLCTRKHATHTPRACGGVLTAGAVWQLTLAETSVAIKEKRERELSAMQGNASGLAGPKLSNIKCVYIVSDSTGFTASHALTSVLGQFEHIKIDWDDQNTDAHQPPRHDDNATEVRTQLLSNVKDVTRINRIVRLAQKTRALIMFTLVDESLHSEMTNRCKELGVPSQDFLGPLVSRLAGFLGSHPTGLPRGWAGTRRKPLSDKYFKRVEAVEFTIKQDDGAACRNLAKADVVLLGVSRSSKTPLSMYLAQQFGYKVANVPLVLNIPPPKEIFQVDPRRVFGLVIQPQYLKRIRTRRLAGTGVDVETIGKESGSFDYSNIKYIQQELREVRDLYAQHPEWSVIDVTGRAVEENAAIIAELMPGKPTPVEAALHALDCNFFIIEPKQGAAGGEDFPIVFASDGFLQATGYTREAITGKSPTVLHGPQTDQAVIKEVWRHLREGLEGRFEVTNHRKDGSYFKKHLHLSPVRNQEGAVAFVFCTQCEMEPLAPGFNPQQPASARATDDGQVKREDLDRCKTSEMLRFINNRGWISVSISDASSPEMPLVFASEGFFKMTGYMASEILGHSLDMLYGADTDPVTIAMIHRAIQAHDTVSTCVLAYRKDGVCPVLLPLFLTRPCLSTHRADTEISECKHALMSWCRAAHSLRFHVFLFLQARRFGTTCVFSLSGTQADLCVSTSAPSTRVLLALATWFVIAAPPSLLVFRSRAVCDGPLSACGPCAGAGEACSYSYSVRKGYKDAIVGGLSS